MTMMKTMFGLQVLWDGTVVVVRDPRTKAIIESHNARSRETALRTINYLESRMMRDFIGR
jgi:uncharacterized membrane protein